MYKKKSIIKLRYLYSAVTVVSLLIAIDLVTSSPMPSPPHCPATSHSMTLLIGIIAVVGCVDGTINARGTVGDGEIRSSSDIIRRSSFFSRTKAFDISISFSGLTEGLRRGGDCTTLPAGQSLAK